MDVDVGCPVLDHLDDIRRGIAAIRDDVPDEAAVLPWPEIVDIIDDLARFASPRIRMNVLGRYRRCEVCVRKSQDRLSLVLAQAERCAPVPARSCRSLSGHARCVERTASLVWHRWSPGG